MAKLALTRGQIIESGLALAGRPDLTSDARLWLNLFLEEMYMSQDFDWLVKTLDDQALTDGMSIPADYRAAKSLKLIGPDGGSMPLEITHDAEEYDARRSDDSAGGPQKLFVDWDQRKFFLIPGAVTGYSIDLKYYYIPSLPDHTDDTTDSDTVKWDLPSHILIDFIKAMAMEYNDDSRQDGAFQKVMGRVMTAKINNKDARAGSSRLKFGKSFRKRFW